jgi:hypothetical protein
MRIALTLSLLLTGSAFAHDHQPAGHERAPAAATPSHASKAGAVYGAALPKQAPVPVAIDAIAANASTHVGKSGAFSGRIAEVCQKQGCWLVLAGEHGELARVFMHEHAFSVPKNASGNAIVYGTLSEKQLSAEEVAHLAKDGASAPAARELQIDATSVLIRDAG